MKIKNLFKLIIVALLFSVSLFSQEVSQQETQQIALVARILKNSTTSKMQQVWPGYNLRAKPMFITFGNGHIYAFNIQLNEGDWKRSMINGVEVLYTNKDLWGITTAPMQFNFEINGQEAFVYRLDMMPEPAFLPFFVMVHERFHVYQIQNFLSEQFNEEEAEHEERVEYAEGEDPNNLALMQLEEQVLLDFMKALSKNSKEEAIFQLKTFISVNRQRRDILSQNSIKWEARQQMVEGLADYAAAKNLDVFAYFGEKMGQRHLLHTMERYTKDDNITERALKWRHYGVGASLGYALDLLQVAHWKKDVEKNVSLQLLLENNLYVSQSESDNLFQQAVQKYDFNQLQIEIREKIDAYNNMLQSHRDRFKQLPGVVVNVQTPPDSGLSAGGYSKGMYSLADGSMFSVQDTSKTSSADNRWILELKSMPYLFQTTDGFKRFKMDTDDLELVLDGKSCSLRQLGQKHFRQLTLRGKSCAFKSTHNEGVVSMRNGELNIIFN